MRTAYLSATRGEGGQNLIGPEQGDLLGVIRTQELLAARKVDGGEQFFTRAIDFGFSKTADEALTKWGREKTLSDIVWVIRRFRPDLIILRFSGTPRDGHGQHQASAILGKEAFFAAADRNRFPEQFAYTQTWQAKRLLFNVFSFSREQEQAAATTPGRNDIGYTQQGYDQRAHGLARTLMHEAGHNCGIPGGDPHWRAAQIAAYCMGADPNAVQGIPFIESIPGLFLPQIGIGLDRGDLLMFLTYRRFLGDWASGRLQATLGVDLSLIGTTLELAERRPELRPPGDFGSVTGGFRARIGGWGGTRYGGISIQVETGIGVGRFALRPAAPSDPAQTTIAPSWILQVGPRAEFLIRFGEHVLPWSIGAALRLAEPINSEAKGLHGLLLSSELRL